jgi:hypothetical protein
MDGDGYRERENRGFDPLTCAPKWFRFQVLGRTPADEELENFLSAGP